MFHKRVFDFESVNRLVGLTIVLLRPLILILAELSQKLIHTFPIALEVSRVQIIWDLDRGQQVLSSLYCHDNLPVRFPGLREQVFLIIPDFAGLCFHPVLGIKEQVDHLLSLEVIARATYKRDFLVSGGRCFLGQFGNENTCSTHVREPCLLGVCSIVLRNDFEGVNRGQPFFFQLTADGNLRHGRIVTIVLCASIDYTM